MDCDVHVWPCGDCLRIVHPVNDICMYIFHFIYKSIRVLFINEEGKELKAKIVFLNIKECKRALQYNLYDFPKLRCVSFEKSFVLRVARCWNCLPPELLRVSFHTRIIFAAFNL